MWATVQVLKVQSQTEDVALHSSHVDTFWTNNDSMGRGSKIGPKKI